MSVLTEISCFSNGYENNSNIFKLKTCKLLLMLSLTCLITTYLISTVIQNDSSEKIYY